MPLALLLGACDLAKPEPPRAAGPPVHLVAIYPADGCGVGAGSACVVPTNATLTLRFDRFLDPSTVNRQALHVYTGDPRFSGSIPFEVVYDPVERVVEYRMPPGYAFAPSALYQLELAVAEGPEDYGIRAFDGAALAEGELPLHESFVTSDEPAELPAEDAPNCATVVGEILGAPLGNCAGQECHRRGGNRLAGRDLLDAPFGLWLDTPEHFAASAIGRIAKETDTGDQSGGIPAEKSPRFGVRMALVDPRNPGGSYLFYKLVRNPTSFTPCSDSAKSSVCAESGDPTVSAHPQLPLADGESIVPAPDELDRLREWFVRGEPMPLPNSQGVQGSVHLQGLRALSTFIAAGADCRR